MTHKTRSGTGIGAPAGPKQTSNGEPYNANLLLSLGVGLPTAAEQEFVEKVMRKLPPGLPEPRIMVLLNTPKHPVEDDAQHVANEHAEPVAIVDMEGQLLAYREPQ